MPHAFRTSLSRPVVIALAFCFPAVLPVCAWAAESAPTTLLTHVRLIDGTGHAPIEDATILIEGNRIAAIRKGTKKSMPGLPAGTRVLDCAGDTVIPGLINAHGHLGLIDKDGKKTPAAYTAPNVLGDLRQYESYGVTTMLSLGLNRDLLYPIRQQQREGKLDGATVFTADRGIGVPGGIPGAPAYQPSSPAEARAAVDAMAARHADFVKIWVDSAYGTKPTMRPDIYRAVISEAHKHHLRVAAHVYYLADAKQLVADGVDVLAHSIRDKPVDAELIAAMKQRGVWYIPTFTVDESFYIYAERPAFMRVDFFKASLPPETLARLTSDAYAQTVERDPKTPQHKADFRMDQQNLRTLYAAGVHIGFGTDSGAFPTRIPGFSEHRELEDMVAAGLTPMQAIVCATRNNARLLRIQRIRGTIQTGKRADLLVLAANPLDDITNTRHIVTIFHDGRQVTPRVPVVTAR